MNITEVRFIRARELARRLSVSTVTLWRWQRDKRLPQPIRLGPGVVAWRLSDIEAFEASREGLSVEPFQKVQNAVARAVAS